MSITLQPETEQKIEERMKDGRFASPDEVVKAALELLDEQQRREADLDGVRRKIALGVEQLDRGEGMDGEAVFEQLLAEIGEGDGAEPGKQ